MAVRAKGCVRDEGTDCHVGPMGLLAMTKPAAICHSEERSDVGIRTFVGADVLIRPSPWGNPSAFPSSGPDGATFPQGKALGTESLSQPTADSSL